MVVVCPYKLKRGEKSFEPKYATATGDIVVGAVNANGKIKVYIGLEKIEGNEKKRFPIVVVEAPECADDVLGDDGRVGGELTVSLYEKRNGKNIIFDSHVVKGET